MVAFVVIIIVSNGSQQIPQLDQKPQDVSKEASFFVFVWCGIDIQKNICYH